ncbi:MAG: (Na+)-NQR maturation NqrM [Pseudomonadales bacterium]
MTALITLLVMLTVVAAMAIGVIMGRKPISGSCGGIAALGLDTECEICGGDPSMCDVEIAKTEDRADEKSGAQFYDASTQSKD